MCIIVYKPLNVAFPTKKTLKTCFDNNSDGAGFMYAVNNKVYIEKGFMGFKSFHKALKQVRMNYGDDIPYVLHFRISTQGGTKQELCHPYPLSSKMEDLKKLNYSADIGIAHNGIIDLTTSYYAKTDYNDTMKFITDYLSLIIKNRNFYKDEDTLTLIERLVDSKLAILDGSGRCTLIGTFTEDSGLYYSNSTYKEAKTTYTSTLGSYSSWYKTSYSKYHTTDYSPYKSSYGYGNYMYEEDEEYIDMYNCGYENYGDGRYCEVCLDKYTCPQYKAIKEIDDEIEDINDKILVTS